MPNNSTSQVIDVFAVAPLDGNRNLSQDQAKALLIKNGINPAKFSEAKLAAFAQQSLAGQQKSIRAYRQSSAQKQQGETSNLQTPTVMIDEAPNDMAEEYKAPTIEEMAYKIVKKRREDPISIELNQSESEAAKAAMG